MCRLFGMTGGTNEVQATFWLLDAPMSLLLQSESQPDGVGLGTFDEGGNPNVYRKPVAANRSQTFISGAQSVRSRTFMAHIRHGTGTPSTLENTHPFEQKGRLLGHNGVLGDLDDLRARLDGYEDLIQGTTDSELYFTLITKRIDENGGDVIAGITAAAQEIAAEIEMYSLNIVLTTATDLWALRYPETNELWILERSLAGAEQDGGDGFDQASATGTMRIQSGALSVLPATVVASEPMDDSGRWRLFESGELIHVDENLNITSTTAVTEQPAKMMVLGEEAAAAQAEPSRGSTIPPRS